MTADGDCSHEIKRCLLLGRKVMLKHKLESKTKAWCQKGNKAMKTKMLRRKGKKEYIYKVK